MISLMQMGQPWRWALACVVLATAILILVDVYRHGGLNAAASAASIVAIVPLGVAVVAWSFRTSRQVEVPTMAQLDKARRDLAGMVREQWLQESGARQLHDPHPVAVRWRSTKRPVSDVPQGGGLGGFTGTTARVGALAERFVRLDRRRMVIIGDPGRVRLLWPFYWFWSS